MSQQGVQSLWNQLLNGAFPPLCVNCQAVTVVGVDRFYPSLCLHCYDLLKPIQSPYCEICGESFPGYMPDVFICGECKQQRRYYDFAMAAFEAEAPLLSWIHRFKYQGQWQLRALLGRLMLEVLEEPRLQNLDAQQWRIVPVPLHWWRFWRRDFNQSEELGRVLARQTGLMKMSALKRVRYTAPQARLSKRQRQRNLRSSFKLKWQYRFNQGLAGKNVILVDDVFTTGATANECAKILRQQGLVEKVVVISLARG